MSKFKSILKLLAGVLLLLCAAGSLLNLLFIVGREETISVVNAVVGLAVLFFFLAPLGQILLRNGLRELRGEQAANESD